jgi:hypothetical protein
MELTAGRACLKQDVYLEQIIFVYKLENKLNLPEANGSGQLLNSTESSHTDLSVTDQRTS